LAFLAVKRLGLHNMMLADSFTLNLAIANSVSILEDLSAEEIVKEGWRYEPPKALSDVFESVMGAVFIDSGCDYEKTATVMEDVMEDALEILTPAIAQNPVSELLEWLAGQGCTKVRFE
jgi:endoribonuclease Dicer